MNKKNLTSIISMTSVFVMLAWGTIAHSYEYAWLVVAAGGILIAVVSMFSDKKNDEQV